MTSQYIAVPFGRERRRAIRFPTAADMSASPTARGKTVRLRDGSKVLIRPVRNSDAPHLADGFARLSARSRQLRFHAPKPRLSQAELRYLTDIDHYDHEAIGALNRGGQGVGIARYVRSADDPRAAEIAITVVDDWQGLGLGTELVAGLSDRARQAGIERFTALVTADNMAVAGLLRKLSARLIRRDSAFLEYEIALLPDLEDDYGFGALIELGRI
jgi:RimJ/RimL family protein N-acetyltransferase